MLGHFYVDTVVSLFKLKYDSNVTMSRNGTKLWLLLEGRHTAIYNSYRLFADEFSQHPLDVFETMLDVTQCRCHTRVIFCGFTRQTVCDLVYTHLCALCVNMIRIAVAKRVTPRHIQY